MYTVAAIVLTDIQKIAKRIKWPVEGWPANCFAVAVAIYDAKLVPRAARCRYGVWWGPIRSKTHFKNRTFTHHGWIELPDKRIYDPTRFVFEDAAPYIYVGRDLEGFYDVAGQRLNARFYTEFPKKEGESIKLTSAQRRVLQQFMPSVQQEDPDFGQMMWLAHYPIQQFEGQAKRVLKIFDELDLTALIPRDVSRYVLEDDKIHDYERTPMKHRVLTKA